MILIPGALRKSPLLFKLLFTAEMRGGTKIPFDRISHNLLRFFDGFASLNFLLSRNVQLGSCKYFVLIYCTAKLFNENRLNKRWKCMDIGDVWLPAISYHWLGCNEKRHENLDSGSSTSQRVRVRVQYQLWVQWPRLCWFQRTGRKHEGKNMGERKEARTNPTPNCLSWRRIN